MPSVTLHRLWSTLLTRQCKAVWQHLIFLASSNKYSQWSTYGFLPGKNVWRPSKSAWNSPIHPNFCVIHIIYSPSFQWMGAMCRMCQLRGPFLCEAFLGCSLVRALTVIEILFNNSTYWTILNRVCFCLSPLLDLMHVSWNHCHLASYLTLLRQSVSIDWIILKLFFHILKN